MSQPPVMVARTFFFLSLMGSSWGAVANLEVQSTSRISFTQAGANGQVTDTGGEAPSVTIFYGSADGGTNPASWNESIALGAQSGGFEATLIDLQETTPYFYRARAINSSGTSWSASAETFTTGTSSDVFINEFLSSNDTIAVPNAVAGIFDDWIEIYNSGPALDLGGWHLTDDPNDLTQWTFPAGANLGTGEYLVMIANGSGEPNANGNPTTNFKLSSGGDFLALVRPDGTIGSEFDQGRSNYPNQTTDVSYGIHPNTGASVYFSSPTPGAANDPAGVAAVSPIVASPTRGYYEAAQAVTLSTATAGAQIYYTSDGSPPLTSTGNPSGTATAYSGPITVSSTAVIRSAATLTNFTASDIASHSYVLLDISGANSNGTDPAGLNSSFLGQTRPVGYGALATGDYNMDPDITNSTSSSANHRGLSVAQAMLQGMRDVPTISISLPKNDFAGGSGIYSNPQSKSQAGQFTWEKACSAEFIPAENDTRSDFQENCGLRVQGGASRTPSKSPKHSLSFRFRTRYGAGKLREALFPGSDVTEFNSIALRAGYNNSWIHSSSSQRTVGSMIRDQWMRESVKDMGHADAGEGFIAHLFINGLYWGLHNIAERQDSGHYANYNGGDEDLIDARNGSDFINGNSTAWNRMRTTVAGGNWEEIQQVLDVDTYIDYHLLQRFGANQDLKTSGNWRAAGGGPFSDPTDMEPWKLFSWDGERVLESPTASNVPLDPMTIRPSLEALPEYRMRFADRARMHLTGDGALTPEKCAERWMKYANNIDKAIIAESARWGDHRRSAPYDRNNWLTEQNRLLTRYFPVRTNNVINRLRTNGLYSDLEPPSFTIGGGVSSGGFVSAGSTLSATGQAGTIYYTSDGSDPSLPDGSVNPSALFIGSGTEDFDITAFGTDGWVYLSDPLAQQSDSNVVEGHPSYNENDWKHPDFNVNTWEGGSEPSGLSGLLAGITASSINGHSASTIINIGPSTGRYPTLYFRKEIEVTGAASVTQLSFSLIRDDGAVVYLNGREIFRDNLGNGTISYSDFAQANASPEGTPITHVHNTVPGDLVEGTNIIAIEIHNSSGTSGDLGVDVALIGTRPIAGNNSISITESSLITARIFDGSDWSAPTQGIFLLEQAASFENLAITEINYHPREATLAEKAAAAPLSLENRDLFEFIEVINTSNEPLNLSQAFFTAGIDLAFGFQALAPGERGVLVRDTDAFTARYGSGPRIVGTFSSSLDNDGELLTLSDSSGSIIKTLTYNDSGSWPSRPDEGGSTLQIIDPSASPDDPNNWRSSGTFHGSPGSEDAAKTGWIVINEVSTNPTSGRDSIELFNTTASDIEISNWLLSDSKGVYSSYRFGTTTIPALSYLTVPSSAFQNKATTAVSDYQGSPGVSPVTIVSNGHGLATGETITISGYPGISNYNQSFEIVVTSANAFQIDTPFLDNTATKGKWVSGRSFGLSSVKGDDIWLVEADRSGPISFVDRVDFAAARENETLGRWPDGDGDGSLFTMASPTLGNTNSGPLLGPAFISEVHYKPLGALSQQFVELTNDSESALNLNRWRLRGGLDFDFTAAHSIPAGGQVIIVSFDPTSDPATAASFRSTFNIGAAMILIGPATDGPLDSASGTVRLQEGLVHATANPQVTVDEVDYLSTNPWPLLAATGNSLQRNAPLAFGNLPTSWSALAPNPGSYSSSGIDYATYAASNGLGGPLDDDDGDGSANIIEFATGSNPSDSASLPLGFGNENIVTFNRNLQAEGVALILESSPDLETWTITTTSEGATQGALQNRFVNFDPSSEANHYWRLTVALP